jgi:hypothetical protein
MICKDCKQYFPIRNTVLASKQKRCVPCMIKILYPERNN